MRKFLTTCAVAVTILFCFAGCNKKSDSGSSSSAGGGGSAKRYTVIFSQCNNAEPYRAAQNDLMTKLWKAKSDVDFTITDAQQDNRKQIEQISTIIRQKPDLLIVAPNERAPLTKVMGEAMAAGIPVICLERDIVEPNYTTFIKCDNYAIGKSAGEFIVNYLKQKNGSPAGSVVRIRGLMGVQAETERNNGAADVWKAYPDIKVIHEGVADWIQSKAKDRMVEALNANPKIDVVYADNDPMAIGAYLAAKDKGREKDMIFVGVDGLPGSIGGIKSVMDGVLAATFIYPLCVDKAVEVGDKIMRDPTFKPEKSYMMDSMPITKDNAAAVYAKTSS